MDKKPFSLQFKFLGQIFLETKKKEKKCRFIEKIFSGKFPRFWDFPFIHANIAALMLLPSHVFSDPCFSCSMNRADFIQIFLGIHICMKNECMEKGFLKYFAYFHHKLQRLYALSLPMWKKLPKHRWLPCVLNVLYMCIMIFWY